MVGITYGTQPYGGHAMGWTSPKVLATIIGGLLVLVAFCVIEPRVEHPMFRGFSFSETPLWAGIHMLPLVAGFLIAGPISGWLSDRHGARPFATGGMLIGAATGGDPVCRPARL